MTFDNTPPNGTVTILSKSTRHLSRPTDDNYSTINFVTYDVSMIQKAEGRISVNPSWAHLRWRNSTMRTRALKLQAVCPEGANYLGFSWFNPSHGGYWTGSLKCLKGAANGSLWGPVEQSDGNISAVVWSQIEEWPHNKEGYTQPLQYLSVIDHDPDDTFVVTDISAYSGNTTTAKLNVTNLPSGALVFYDITGIRKGAPVDGLQAYSIGGSPASTITLADVISDLDSVIQHVKVYKWFTEQTSDYVEANYHIYKYNTNNNFETNTTWNFSDFPTAPNPGGVSLQQEGRLTLKASGFGKGNKNAVFHVLTATNQPEPIFIRWYAYTTVNSNTYNLEYNFPKLPNELSAYAPNLNFGFVVARISGQNHDLFPDQFITQGTGRSVYVKKRDNISDQSVADAHVNVNSELIEGGVEKFVFPPINMQK